MKKIILILTFAIFQFGLFAQEKTNFSEAEILLKTTTGNIYGTLSVPEITIKTPLIIIIPGSGGLNRDGNMPPALVTNMYKMLSERFAKNGISCLRYDKRAIGQSRPAAAKEADLRFETYIKDVVDWISLLTTDKRFSEIILLGHSEGSLIGMIAAEQTKITGFISLAGVRKSADKILQEQLKGKLPQLLEDESNRILNSLRNGKTVLEINPNLASIYRPSVQPYLISWMKYDPAIEIAKLKIPVLLIQGTTDLQVSVDDAKLLSEAKPDAKLVIINNMNHVLKESSSDVQENSATYRNPELPLKSELVDKILKFVKTE